MLVVYGALILLPLLGLARGELKTYQPLELALPAMSIFYCFNIFSKLAVGALSGFEYVAILAGETRAPARDIGRFGSHRFAGDRPDVHSWHELGARVHRQQPDRSHRSGAANPETRAAFLPNRRRHRLDWNFVNDRAHDLFDQRSRNRQLAIADGRGLGSAAAELVFRDCIRDTKRRLIPSSSSARPHFSSRSPARSAPESRKRFQLVDNAANVFYGIVYFTMFAIPIFGAGAISFRCSDLVAHCGRSAVLPCRCPLFFLPSTRLSTCPAR